jgi:hypothetical protein
MTDKQKAELVALIEKGSRTNVGYYYSAGVMFERFEGSGRICADVWGFALIGKFGIPTAALNGYERVYKVLPDSNPGCMQMLYAVAQILGLDWKELVEIHYACHSNRDDREDGIREFKKNLHNLSILRYAKAVMADAFAEYEAKLAAVSTPAN